MITEDLARKTDADAQKAQAQIEAWFTYHAPNAEQQKRYQDLRTQAKCMAICIYNCTRPGPDQSAAFRLLRECVMTANASIALEPPADA